MAGAGSRAGGAATARRAAGWLVLALVAVAAGWGCSPESRYRVLALLFEDAPLPGEEAGDELFVRSPRHPQRLTPTPLPTPAVSGGADGPVALASWDDVIRLLPKDDMGDPDWTAALEEKVIAPRPGREPDSVESEVLTLDVDFTTESDPAFKVTFSHQKHGVWLACPNCHTGMFEMRAGATPMRSHEAHSERYCGMCHGTVAFDIKTGCQSCHLRNLPRDASGRVDWNRALTDKFITPRPGLHSHSPEQPVLDRDVELPATAQPALASVFSHAAHTKWLSCANCHPKIFPMAARIEGASGVDLHSRRYCGACHGPVSFGMIGGCGRCHPALEKARQHQEVMDLDVEITRKSQPSTKTIFSHKAHRWVECANCHAGFFGTSSGESAVPPADLYGGKYCAVCHGKVASELVSACQRCHATRNAQ